MRFKTYTTYGFLVIVLLFKFTSLSGQSAPNIILIMADDLGYETLGCNGSEEYNTPHLDRMAEEGMRFTNCHAMPLCTPSRVQIMTGKYNFRNYVSFGILDPAEKTFGHYLQEAGYQNLIVGKWQLYGNEYQQNRAGGRKGSLPEEAGFDDYLLWQIKDRGFRYKNPTLDSKKEGLQTYPGHYGPKLFVDYIMDFIETQREQPFFVYYPMVITHDPFLPTPDHPEFDDYDAGEKVNNARYFDGMVSYMDMLVGRLVDKVNDLGIAENTLILFIGDNGTDRDVTSMFQGQVVRGNKGYTTDAGTHVPMIAWWPGRIKAGIINENLIDFSDFLPSLLDMAGMDIPEDQMLDGISFYNQLIKGPDVNQKRAWIFCDYNPNWGEFEPSRYVFDTDWKLYENGDIYHLKNDIREEHALQKNTLSPAVQKRIKEFEGVLERMK